MYKYFFKRIVDFLIALIGIIILSPIFLILIVWLHFANKVAGVFFTQQRPGKNEKIFKLFKLKTMTDEKDSEGRLLPDEQRLTKIGKIMRSTSIDEIPQLINVLKGEMSLVGPRPMLLKYLPYFSDKERLRFQVKPGITGLAQVSGRNALSWDKRFSCDVEYVKNVSFGLDLKILMLTIVKVFSSENVVVDPESIMKNLDDERRVPL